MTFRTFDNAFMGKKKSSDRHKPSKQVRLRKSLADQLEVLAERNATTVPEEVNRAVRLLLEREGLWPPPADAPKGADSPR